MMFGPLARISPSDAIFTWTPGIGLRSEEHTSELQSRSDLVCRLLLEKKKTFYRIAHHIKLNSQKFVDTLTKPSISGSALKSLINVDFGFIAIICYLVHVVHMLAQGDF